MANPDALSYLRTSKGDLAVYLGNRRIGTIVSVVGGFAYAPSGWNAGRAYPSEQGVKDSLMRDDDCEDGDG